MNLKEDRLNRSLNRYRMLSYYILIFIENTAFSLVWFFLRDENAKEDDAFLAVALVVLVMISFFVGIAFLLIYYIVLHPTISKKPFCRSNSSRSQEVEQHVITASVADVTIITPSVELTNQIQDIPLSKPVKVEDVRLDCETSATQQMCLLTPSQSPSLLVKSSKGNDF